MAKSPQSFRIGVAVGEIALLILAGLVGAGIYRQVDRQEVQSPLGCVETVITKVDQPADSSTMGAGVITFRDDIAPGHGTKAAQILSVLIPYGQYGPGDAGDRARVCLLSVPAKTGDEDKNGKWLGQCNPSLDVRGRSFLVYDRATQVAQVYSNGYHGCGGA